MHPHFWVEKLPLCTTTTFIVNKLFLGKFDLTIILTCELWLKTSNNNNNIFLIISKPNTKCKLMDEKLRNNLWNYKADKKFQSFAKIELQLKKSSYITTSITKKLRLYSLCGAAFFSEKPLLLSVSNISLIKTGKNMYLTTTVVLPPQWLLHLYPEKANLKLPPLSPLCHLLTLRIYCITTW